jgi:hypothetical protein
MAGSAVGAANPAFCLGCGAFALRRLLDFGDQPASNRFVGTGVDDFDRHPLVLGQCASCALVQLVDPMPATSVRPRYDWLAYNEPEGHLDALVDRLTRLPGISSSSRIAGLTYKDDSTLGRLNRLGYSHTQRYDPMNDFGITDPLAGLETTQAVVDESLTTRLIARRGHADLLIVRHVIEHAHNPSRFLSALALLVADDGYLVLEVPDCIKFLCGLDYSFVWEEHITYFCAATLRVLARRCGLREAALEVYPYPLEDSLVAVFQRCDPGGSVKPTNEAIAESLQMASTYANAFDDTRSRLRAHLVALRGQGTRIAVFGAGHLAAKFLNLFALGDLVDCVVDDNPNKQGLLMPGSRLPILGSAALAERSIGLCLLSVSPESEPKVVARRQDHLDRGGSFASIFALSPLALRLS